MCDENGVIFFNTIYIQTRVNKSYSTIVIPYGVCVVDFQQGAKKAYKTNDIV
jgi:hypothetical protein